MNRRRAGDAAAPRLSLLRPTHRGFQALARPPPMSTQMVRARRLRGYVWSAVPPKAWTPLVVQQGDDADLRPVRMKSEI